MKEIHRIREEFYRETKGKNREYILKLIKEDSQKVIQELENIKPDPKLIVKEKYQIQQSDSIQEIHQIRERDEKYGK
jgi:DNA relaxase NicK